jgi:hypothetical protein
VPTLGTALLILAGINAINVKLPLPLRLSSTLVPVAIGKLSYALYLWHWPVFELYQTYFDSWTAFDRVIALGVTVLLSIASHVLVENPIRFSKGLGARPLQSLGAAAAVTLVIVTSAESLEREAGSRFIILPSGLALTSGQIKRDRATPNRMADCHLGLRSTTYDSCIYAKRNSSNRVFLIGDSHALHWFPAVEGFADKYDLQLYLRTKSACSVVKVPLFLKRLGRAYHECDQWTDRVLEEIERIKPKIVIIALSSRHEPVRPGTRDRLTGAERLAALAQSEHNTIERIAATGARVVMVADTPWLPEDPIDCLIENSRRTWLCRWPEQDVLPRNGFPWSFEHDKPPPGVNVVDLSDKLCWDGFCYAANDTHVIMRDRDHLTASFATTLGAILAERLGFERTLAQRP